ncbi:MAG: hypothetical protein AAGL49_10090 [Pseudomonadota bacterium]
MLTPRPKRFIRTFRLSGRECERVGLGFPTAMRSHELEDWLTCPKSGHRDAVMWTASYNVIERGTSTE